VKKVEEEIGRAKKGKKRIFETTREGEKKINK